MACRDVWNTWHEGLRSPQNPTAKPEGFVATGGPRAMYFTHHGKPWLKPFIARPLGKIWYKTVVTLHKWSQQRRQSTTAIRRRRSKLGLGCSREATAPLILIFKLVFLWLNIGRHLKELLSITIVTHQNILAKILPGNQYLSQNMYKNNNVDLHFYRHRRSFICRESFSAGTHVHFAVVPYTPILGKRGQMGFGNNHYVVDIW